MMEVATRTAPWPSEPSEQKDERARPSWAQDADKKGGHLAKDKKRLGKSAFGETEKERERGAWEVLGL